MVDAAYGAPLAHGGAGLVLATYCFAIQIYCDFSGYSDVALGAARVMGFRLMENFDRPYGAASLAEFWHRWHISLSTWFRDYLYIPLGGNRVSTPRRYANVLVVFLVSGLWHGASWTFVVWGAVHGLGLVASELSGRGAPAARDTPRGIARAIRVVLTFNLVCAAWVFFRAPTVADAKVILWRMVSPDAWLRAADLDLVRVNAEALWVGGVGTLVMLAVEVLQGDRTVGESAHRLPLPARWAAYYALILAIVFVGGGASHSFIYFQF